ncbi:MAG: hypothetical protein RLZZ511_2226 [Cyanobacteriota bacterium]
MGGEDAEADEVCAKVGGELLAFDRVDFEPELVQIILKLGTGSSEDMRIVVK